MVRKRSGEFVEKSHKKRNVWLFVPTILLLLLLAICTVFGDEIYTWITPEVPVQRAERVMDEDGVEYVCVPKCAVTEEHTIYVVTSEQGFSRTIYRIREMVIEYMQNENMITEVLVVTKIPSGSFIVTESEKADGLCDGDKVLIRKARK